MELEVQEGKSTTTASPKKKTNVCSINIRDVKSVKEWVDRQTDDAKEWSDKGKFEFVLKKAWTKDEARALCVCLFCGDGDRRAPNTKDDCIHLLASWMISGGGD